MALISHYNFYVLLEWYMSWWIYEFKIIKVTQAQFTRSDRGRKVEENRLTHNPSTPLPPEISLLTFQPLETVITLGLVSGHGTTYPTLNETICKTSNYGTVQSTYFHNTFINGVIQQRNLAMHVSVSSDRFMGSFYFSFCFGFRTFFFHFYFRALFNSSFFLSFKIWIFSVFFLSRLHIHDITKSVTQRFHKTLCIHFYL